MQKILFGAFLALMTFTSCNQGNVEVKEDEVTKKNLEACRAIGKAFETGNTTIVDEVVADDFVDHTDRGEKVGKDSLKAMINFVQANFKNMKSETLHEMADKDYVFQWMRFTGTSNGVFMPAGPYDFHTMEIARFKDGKVVEHWAYMDMAEMQKMMPAPPPPPPPPAIMPDPNKMKNK